MPGECTSSTVSEYLWWWRCLADHQRTPFWSDVWDRTASTSWNARLVSYDRCEKYRWNPAVIANMRRTYRPTQSAAAVQVTPLQKMPMTARCTSANGMAEG